MTDGNGLRLVSVAFARHIKRRYIIPEPEPGPLQRQATRYTPMTLTRHPVVQSIAEPTPARVSPVIERTIEPARPASAPATEPSQSPALALMTPEVEILERGRGHQSGFTGAVSALGARDGGPLSPDAEPASEPLAPPRPGFTVEEVRRALQRPRSPASSQASPGTQAAGQARGGARPSATASATPPAPGARPKPVSQLYEQPPAQQAGTPTDTVRTQAARGPARAEGTADRPTSQLAAPLIRRTAETQSTVSTTEATVSPQGQGPTTSQTVRRETAVPDFDTGTPGVPVRPATDLADTTAETPPPAETGTAGPSDASSSAQPLRRESEAISRAQAVYRAPEERSAPAGPTATPEATREQVARPADTQPVPSDSEPIPEMPMAPAPAVTLQSDAIEPSPARVEQRDALHHIRAAAAALPETPEGALTRPEAPSFEPAVEPDAPPVKPVVRRSPDVQAPAVTAAAEQRRAPGSEHAPVQSVPASLDLAEAYRAQLQRFATEASTEPETIPPWPEPAIAQLPPSSAPPIQPRSPRESAQWVQEVPPAQTPPASAGGSALSAVTPTSQHPPVRRQTGFPDRTPAQLATAEQQRLTPGAPHPLPRQVLPIDQVVASMAAPTRVTRDRGDSPGPPIRRAEAPADTTRADSSTETAPAESEESPQAERAPDIEELAERVFSKLRDRLRVERERMGGSRLR